MISLEESKAFLRVDADDEDALISSLVKAAEELVESVLRFPLSELGENVPETVRQTILFALAQLYELRDSLDVQKLIESLSRILFAYRREEF